MRAAARGIPSQHTTQAFDAGVELDKWLGTDEGAEALTRQAASEVQAASETAMPVTPAADSLACMSRMAAYGSPMRAAWESRTVGWPRHACAAWVW